LEAWGGGGARGSKERNLVISPAAEADSGNYVCEAISKGDEEYHLKVIVGITIVWQTLLRVVNNRACL
jgi:hypothetical protein